MRSSFFGFSTAQRALSINQKALDIVGQNISNMDTEGYTRQRLDLVSIQPPASGGTYVSLTSSGVGQGSKISQIAQVRDPYLDVRFRQETPKVGEVDSKLQSYYDLERVIDETMVEGVSAQLADFLRQLQSLSTNAGNPEFDTIVKSSAEVFAKTLNQYSGQIETIRDQQYYNFNDVAVQEVNNILESIAKLNQDIKKAEITNNGTLELNDKRNLLIDELSAFVKIDVTTKPIEISPGIVINELTITIPETPTSPEVVLVDKDEFSQFTTSLDATTGKVTLLHEYPTGGVVTDLTDDLASGSFKGYIEMLNYSGEYDTPPNAIKGIGYFEQMFDTFAAEFANQLNHMNSIEVDPPTVPPTYEVDGWLPLFESSDGGPITAGNIQISDAWRENEYGITATKIDNPGDDSGANENIMKMIAAFSEAINFQTPGGTTIFEGTFQEYISNTSNVLALEISSNVQLLDSYLVSLTSMENMRDSVSGVSLDEEGINLIKYQQAYNAAARFMTTLDEALDTIINNMGRVGR